MEYQVPQFIDVEDKIIGPLSLKQFIYLAGSAGLCVIFFAYLPFIFAVLLSLPVAGFGAALAFYKINGKSFLEVLEAGFNYYVHEKLLLWKQTPPGERKESGATGAEGPVVLPPRGAPKLTRGKLSELAWSLDVKQTPPDAK
jgi:hypothetical protein